MIMQSTDAIKLMAANIKHTGLLCVGSVMTKVNTLKMVSGQIQLIEAQGESDSARYPCLTHLKTGGWVLFILMFAFKNSFFHNKG